MKIEIRLKGCSYEDSEDIKIFLHSRDLYSMVWETRQKIRSRLKYDEGVTDIEEIFLEELIDELTLDGLELG